jgi:hypothetical protein
MVWCFLISATSLSFLTAEFCEQVDGKIIKFKMALFWVVALVMEAAGTSETSVNFYQTARRNNPEDSHLRTRCRENLKSHEMNVS